jgi:bacillithiol biosynthesis cysteine-adding enzyme BshC
MRVGRPGGSPLVQAYLDREPHALRFYAGSYRDPEAFREKAHLVDGRFDRAKRERALEAIRPSGDLAAEKLRRVLEEDGFFVTTGQQPGLFGGPLYSLYKAITAARLAARLEDLLGRPVAPLFWIADEDHDWPEGNHTFLIDTGNEMREFRLPPEVGEPGRPFFRVPLGSDLAEQVTAFLDSLPGSDFAAPFRALLADAYPEGATLGSGFGAVLARLLEPLWVSFVDASNPVLKQASREAMAREVAQSAAHEELLTRVSGELEAEGYHVQVPIMPGGVNLFMEGPTGERERIYRDGDGFQLRHSETRLSEDDILQRIQDDPGTVSPNVLLRPVVESTVFPTLAYVAGPGEMAYYAQLREFFEAHALSMPVIFPRHGALLLETKIRKVLDKFDLDVSDLDQPFHELASQIARSEEPEEIRAIIGELRGALGKGAQALMEESKSIDPTLKGPINHMRGQGFQLVTEVEKKILHSIKRENEIALGQVEKAQHHLFPSGKPQERVMNAFYYLARYGEEFVPALAERFEIEL